VEFLILETGFEEVLLGHPLMKLLGIDVNAHLNSVRKEFHDREFSDAPSLGQGSSGTLSRIFLMSHPGNDENQLQNEEADHTVNVPAVATIETVHPSLSHYVHGSVEYHAGVSPMPSIPIGEDAEGEVAEALAKRVEVAVENGLPMLGAADLRRLLKQYERIFALKLGPPPPCVFPPLVVKMPADVKPVQARPRPMPAAKRQFVQDETAALTKYNMIYLNPTSERAILCTSCRSLAHRSTDRWWISGREMPCKSSTLIPCRILNLRCTSCKGPRRMRPMM
jgi:hypothetical protein